MTSPDYYDQGVDTAYPATLDDGVTPDPATLVLLGHTGTLMTDGHGNGDTERVVTRDGYDVLLGADTSAAAINPYLDPDLDPAALPDSYVAAPVYDGPIY